MDPIAPSTFFAWLTHTGTHNPGAIAFFMADFFLFFGVAVLTVVQASQVGLLDKFHEVIFRYYLVFNVNKN